MIDKYIMRQNHANRYTLIGVLFGLCFPVFSTCLEAYLLFGNVALETLSAVQRDQPLLWVIDTAPLFLGLFARIGGIKYDKLVESEGLRASLNETLQEINHSLEEKVQQRTEELAASMQAALQAATAKARFLTNMSHEIRTPLNGVLGTVHLLKETRLDQQQQDYLNTISQSATLLLDIVNEILDYAKLEQGKVELECVRFDMCYLVHDVVEMLLPTARLKSLNLQSAIDIPLHYHYQGDPFRIKQALINLIGNAIKFTHEGFVKVSVVKLQSDDDGDILQFSVDDTGIGIDDQTQCRLFNSFEQADSSTTRRYGGTGLGLAIVKELVTLMGGELGVYSEPGNGACFWFRVKLSRAEKPSGINAADMRAINIMLIEGEDTPMSAMLRRQLSRLQVNNVISATTPTQAMAYVKNGNEESVQIIILDHTVGALRSGEFAQMLKLDAALEDIALLLLTMAPLRGDAAHYRRCGFSGYFVYPLSDDSLHKALSCLVSRMNSVETHEFINLHVLNEIEFATQYTQAAPVSKLRVLLVEDEPTNQMVSLAMLNKLEVHASAAQNGEEAVALIQSELFDIVFMDCNMPMMDGYDATAQIRLWEQQQSRLPVPVVALTASDTDHDRKRCFKCGMNAFMTKPVSLVEFNKMLERFCSGRRVEGLSTSAGHSDVKSA